MSYAFLAYLKCQNKHLIAFFHQSKYRIKLGDIILLALVEYTSHL